MNGSVQQAEALMQAIHAGATSLPVAIAILPSFIHLPMAARLLQSSSVAWGAQNLHTGTHGAFTGEVSGTMLADLGCQWVLVGHSERRTLFHEDLSLVAAKFAAALTANLKPILCVGESLDERNAGKTEVVIATQLESVIASSGIQAFKQAVIAYEPIWAIGTGLTATPEQAQNVHAFIRNLLAKHDSSIAKSISLLYGGSVKADNASGLFAMPDIDGALVGGASLDADNFLSICQAAVSLA